MHIFYTHVDFLRLIFHRSLGLAIPPRIRFLQRMQKKVSTDNSIKIEDEEINKISTNSADNSKQENSEQENSSDTSDVPDIADKGKKPIKKENLTSLQFGKKIKKKFH